MTYRPAWDGTPGGDTRLCHRNDAPLIGERAVTRGRSAMEGGDEHGGAVIRSSACPRTPAATDETRDALSLRVGGLRGVKLVDVPALVPKHVQPSIYFFPTEQAVPKIDGNAFHVPRQPPGGWGRRRHYRVHGPGGPE
jgi:hypothetical protein